MDRNRAWTAKSLYIGDNANGHSLKAEPQGTFTGGGIIWSKGMFVPRNIMDFGRFAETQTTNVLKILSWKPRELVLQ